MKNVILLTLLTVILCCNTHQIVNEREILKQKIEAFQFLSQYHHQLHVMIGEEDGDIKKAYKEFYNAIRNQNNVELIPVIEAVLRINPIELNPESDDCNRLDYLVDYYQSGLSMQIEGIFRGHGHLEILDMVSALDLYDKIKE